MPGGLGEPSVEELEHDLIFAGLLAMRDPPRPEAKEAITKARRAGLEVVMITGDHKSTAEAIARELDLFRVEDVCLTGSEIDEISDERLAEIVEKVRVYARVSPEHKLRIVRAWKGKGHVVAMTGDGVNDAPALTQANVGLAIGTGTDIAIESADVTLVSGSLSSVVTAIRLSKRTFKKIKQNLFWAFFYNVVAIPMAVFGLLHPLIAEVAMATSSVNVVTNSLRLRREKI